MKIKAISFNRVIIFGVLIYTSFSIGLLWNYMEVMTKIIILIQIAIIGILYFLIAKYQSSKKEYSKFVVCLALITILYVSLKLLFTFIHEANHANTVLIYKINLIEIRFLKFGVGATSFGETGSSLIESNIVISGSLGNAIILTLFLLVTITSRKDLKLEIYIPHYIIFSAYLFEEIKYWQTSIINGWGDGWHFLELNSLIDISSTLLIITCILWMEVAILSIFFLYDLYTRVIRGRINLIQMLKSMNLFSKKSKKK